MRNNALRVAVVATNTLPMSPNMGYGGSERAAYEVATALVACNHNVDLYCAEGSFVENDISVRSFVGSAYDEEFMSGDIGRSVTASNLGRIANYAELSSMRFSRYITDVTEDLRLRKNKIDVVHLHSTSPILIRNITQLGLPTVITIHNDEKATHLPKLGDTSCSYLSLSDTHHARVNAGRSDIIKLNAGVQDPRQGLVVRENKIDYPKQFLLYVGAISRRKGVATVIDIAQKADIPLVIAGPILPWTPIHYQSTTEYFRQFVEPHIDQDNIKYISNVNDLQRNELMFRATATVVASGYEDNNWQEPFGRVVAESLFCGTPVLAARRSGGASRLLGKTGMLFDNVEHAVRQLNSFDWVNAEECVTSAQTAFGIERYIDKLVSIYLERIFRIKSVS